LNVTPLIFIQEENAANVARLDQLFDLIVAEILKQAGFSLRRWASSTIQRRQTCLFI